MEIICPDRDQPREWFTRPALGSAKTKSPGRLVGDPMKIEGFHKGGQDIPIVRGWCLGRKNRGGEGETRRWGRNRCRYFLGVSPSPCLLICPFLTVSGRRRW